MHCNGKHNSYTGFNRHDNNSVFIAFMQLQQSRNSHSSGETDMKIITAFAIFVGTIFLYVVLSNQLMFYYLVSGSMEPSIPVGSLVAVVPDKFIYEGDVVAFRRGDATILHRAAEIHENYLFLSADAFPDFREIITWDMVIGKAILAVPLLGYVFMALTTQAGLSFVFTVLVLVFFLRGDRNLGFWPAAGTAIAMTIVTLRSLDFTQSIIASSLAVSALSLASFAENRLPDGRKWAELAYIAVFTASVLLIFRSDLRWLFA